MNSRMERYATKLLGLVLAAALLALSACNADNPPSAAETSSGSSAKGRYVEEELALPQPDVTPISLSERAGTLRLLAHQGIFDSTDGGKTWKKTDSGSPTLDSMLKKGEGLSSASWGPDGSLVFAQRGEKETYRYWIVDPDGTERELLPDLPPNEAFSGMSVFGGDDSGEEEPEATAGKSASVDLDGEGGEEEPEVYMPGNYLQNLQFLPDGTLLGLDQNGTIYQIDPENGSFLQNLKPGKNNHYTDLAVTKSSLAARHYNGVDLYSLEDWKPREPDTVLNEFFNGTSDTAPVTEAEGGTYPSTTTIYSSGDGFMGDAAMFAGAEEDSLYFCTDDGIYRHILDGSAMEQVVNGALTSLTDPTFHVQSMIRTADGSFKSLCWKESGGPTSVVSYRYDPDMAAMPEKELKAYALNDSTELRQAIAMYQKAHPDVYINLELALSGGGAMTLSDALRALNTNIMAGKGPDVLFLDGMPVENYLEKGLLADLGDLVQKTAAGDGLFENVTGIYRKDGKDYAIPTRFRIPILDAKSDVLSSIQDLSSAADAMERLRKENPEQKSITGLDNASTLLDQLYDTSSPAWIKEDGSLDPDALTQFLQDAKRIFGTTLPEEEIDSQGGNFISVSSTGGGSSVDAIDLVSGARLVSYDRLTSPNALSSLVSVNEKLGDYAYAPQMGQAKNVFVPTGLVGVSAKSAQPEEARAFVEYLFSQEAQMVSQGLGLPVNRAAFDSLSRQSSDMGGGVAVLGADGNAVVQLDLRSPTDEEYAALQEMIESLDTPALQDTAIREAVLEAGVSYLEGDTELEAAVDAILKKVNLYLSE